MAGPSSVCAVFALVVLLLLKLLLLLRLASLVICLGDQARIRSLLYSSLRWCRS